MATAVAADPTQEDQRIQVETRPSPTQFAPKFRPKDVAGQYFLGDGLGLNCSLLLTRDGRFKYVWTGCLGEYGRAKGTWKLEGDVVLTSIQPLRQTSVPPTQLPQTHQLARLGRRLVPVPWGKSMYLVDENEVPAFAASARKPLKAYGAELIFSSDYKRPIPTSGSKEPLLPARFEDFFRNGPAVTRVTGRRSDGTVVLEGGSTHRLYPGLFITSPGWGDNAEVEVLYVTGSKAVGQPYRLGKNAKPIKIGTGLWTGDEFSRPLETSLIE